MASVVRSLALLYLPVLLLTSCASVRKHYVDPAFQAHGLEGGVVMLKCSAQPRLLPYGLAPQDEREILEEARRTILARHRNVQLASAMDGKSGSLKPAYAFEIHVTHDSTDRKEKRFRGFHRVESTRFVLSPQARTRVRRTVSAVYTVEHLPTQRVVWRASGSASFADWYRINLDSDLLPPDRRPNIGPPLSEVLRPVTRRCCGKLP